MVLTCLIFFVYTLVFLDIPAAMAFSIKFLTVIGTVNGLVSGKLVPVGTLAGKVSLCFLLVFSYVMSYSSTQCFCIIDTGINFVALHKLCLHNK